MAWQEESRLCLAIEVDELEPGQLDEALGFTQQLMKEVGYRGMLCMLQQRRDIMTGRFDLKSWDVISRRVQELSPGVWGLILIKQTKQWNWTSKCLQSMWDWDGLFESELLHVTTHYKINEVLKEDERSVMAPGGWGLGSTWPALLSGTLSWKLWWTKCGMNQGDQGDQGLSRHFSATHLNSGPSREGRLLREMPHRKGQCRN